MWQCYGKQCTMHISWSMTTYIFTCGTIFITVFSLNLHTQYLNRSRHLQHSPPSPRLLNFISMTGSDQTVLWILDLFPNCTILYCTVLYCTVQLHGVLLVLLQQEVFSHLADQEEEADEGEVDQGHHLHSHRFIFFI